MQQKQRTFCFKIIFLFVLLHSCLLNAASITLNQRQLCDLELLLNEGFYPLDGFVGRQDYDRVVQEMRLANGSLWPMPIVLDITEQMYSGLKDARQIILKDPDGDDLALLHVSDIWKPDKKLEAQRVYGTLNPEHPGAAYLLQSTGDYYVGGRVEKIALPKHYDFISLRKTPAELKQYFKENGISQVIGFQTRNPMHRAHLELTLQAANQVNAHILIHPAVGLTKQGDIDHFTRVKCYKKLMGYFPEHAATLSLLPIAMRMAGPREALWHAIIRKNFGCTHFIIGRDHAGPGKDSQGQDFYEPYAAQEMVTKYSDEIGINILTFCEMVYVKEDNNYQQIDEIDPHKTILKISGTQLRQLLREGAEIPEWFSFPEVIAELRKVYPPKAQQGFTLFLKNYRCEHSALINALSSRLAEMQERAVTILNDELVKTALFSESDSMISPVEALKRARFVAGEITKNKGIAICALEDINMISNERGRIEIDMQAFEDPFEISEVVNQIFKYLYCEGYMVEQ